MRGGFVAWWGTPAVPILALVGVIPAGGEDTIPVDPKPLRRRVSSPLRPPPDALPPQGARAETTHPLPGAWGFFGGGGEMLFSVGGQRL